MVPRMNWKHESDAASAFGEESDGNDDRTHADRKAGLTETGIEEAPRVRGGRPVPIFDGFS